MSDTTKKGKKGRRLDKNRITLKKGEYQRSDGVYSYRWTSRYGQRHEVYAGTLEELRRKEEQIKLDIADGIRMDIMSTTVNDLFDLWCDLKRGLKDNTLQNYKYMYNSLSDRPSVKYVLFLLKNPMSSVFTTISVMKRS